jgi:hypothetical protein
MAKIWIGAGIVAALAAAMPASLVTQGTDAGAAPDGVPSAGAPVPVLVELFTSEGCSSCPPADRVLSALAAQETTDGARVIALGEHVDYWDHLGWRDHFSSARFTARQQEYARALRSDVYTPQMIVGGRKAFVGSDMSQAKSAIAAVVRDTADRVHVSITRVPGNGRDIAVTVAVEPADGQTFAADLDVLLALTQDRIVTHVASGENGGHRLQHSAVVRTLETIGAIGRGSSAWSKPASVHRSAGWPEATLSVVAFARLRSNLKVTGADSLKP